MNVFTLFWVETFLSFSAYSNKLYFTTSFIFILTFSSEKSDTGTKFIKREVLEILFSNSNFLGLVGWGLRGQCSDIDECEGSVFIEKILMDCFFYVDRDQMCLF